jgi:hypothetical protein
MYTHAEHLQKTAEVKTRGSGNLSIGSVDPTSRSKEMQNHILF